MRTTRSSPTIMRFKAHFAVFVATCAVAACSNEPDNDGLIVGATYNGATNSGATNSAMCDPSDACYSDEIVVEMCEPEDLCATRENCGVEVICKQVPDCADPLQCASGTSRVGSCEGLDRCEHVDDYCGVFCHPSQVVGTDFEQACSKASDCVAINEGDGCECPSCPDAAINVDARELYDSIQAAAVCSGNECRPAPCEEDLITACVSGACAVQLAQRVAADDFDRTCQTDQDCAAVFEGEICAECQCPNAAVNLSEKEAYDAQFDETCLSDAPCPCVGDAASCVDGMCRGPGG